MLFSTQSELYGAHRNHFLFSDHYLNNIVFGSGQWEQSADAVLRFLSWVTAHYEREKGNLSAYSEAQLEANWFRPIFDQLSWQNRYETQAVIPAIAEANVRRPDYLFYDSEESRHNAVQTQSTKNAVAVGEVKRWGIALDKQTREGQSSFDRNNPHYQIDYYLRATALDWGILSNGRLWRLVNRESSYKLDVYFEIDLVSAIENQEKRTIIYFYLFFCQQSFIPHPLETRFVDDVLSGSLRYARELEADLTENAYKALEQLILGYFAFGRNKLDPHRPDHLQTVYTNSLYFLYRLLFLFYAESRYLLPIDNPEYQAMSFTRMTKRVAEQFDKSAVLSSSTALYANINDLTHLIHGSDPALNRQLGVPCYNGGLFNPDLHLFLEEKKMTDGYLARAIDYLARRDSHKQGDYAIKEMVDYRTLGVRQLGSIYEGLLEYTPRLAHEPMVTIRRKGQELWVPLSERGKAKELDHRKVGELYLATDKGERKTTGSYYTPDAIVKYIVQQTIDPLLAELRDKSDSPQQLIEAVLSLHLLDPAMGSGHFLVEATDHLARALASYQSVEMEKSADFTESDLVYWRRRVVESCIYGVDKNSMAVELAKLSLWLVTVAKDKPLSFLDHHLRHGDSLVGARLVDLHTLPSNKVELQSKNQTTLFNETAITQDIFKAVGGMGTIKTMLSETLEDVHAKEVMYQQLREHLNKWRTLADLWISRWFGNTLTPHEYGELLRYLQGAVTTLAPAQFGRFLHHSAVQTNDYFHWEVEFPEIYFNSQGQSLGANAGFDAIIGNPPYGLIPAIPAFATFPNDAFIYFWVSTIRSLKSGGRLGLITPSSWLTGVNYKPLRTILLDETQVEIIVDLPYDIFPDAYIDTCIAIVSRLKEGEKGMMPTNVMKMANRADASSLLTNPSYFHLPSQIWRDDPNHKFILNPRSYSFLHFQKDPNFIPLAQIGRIERGVQLYSRKKHREEEINADFLRLKKKPRPEMAKNYWPELLGEELSRHSISAERKSWIHYCDEIASKRDSDLFEQPRVVLRRLLTRRRRLQGAVTAEKAMTTDNILSIVPKIDGYHPSYLSALLNSKLLSWFYTNSSTISVKDDFPQVTYDELGRLPIPLIERFSSEAQKSSSSRLIAFWESGNDAALLATLMELKSSPLFQQVGHDVLAYSAEKMVQMNREKQKTERRFWLDLEGIVEEKAFAKVQKGKTEQFLYKTLTATRPFVRESSHHSCTLVDALCWDTDAFKGFVKLLLGTTKKLSNLLDLYENYHAEYQTLVTRIEATDQLIDQIVYQLYHLTQEQIATIESAIH